MNDTITAYHGSPHDFEQFDTSKIGTGEGAQAYGHGLYFAESEPVAEGYRNRLTDHPPNQVIFPNGDGNRYHPESLDDPVEKAAAKALLTYSSSKGYKDYLRRAPIEPETAVAAMKLIKNKEIISAPAGHMYEVAIDAHPDHFLDWDKPLNEQSDHVQNAITAIKSKYGQEFGEEEKRRTASGEAIYNDLMENASWLGYGKKPKESASNMLLSHGIHGIKYLDANSRGQSDQPTHNYVVFDHNRVNVKRKYEQGGAVEAYGDGGFIPHGDPKRDANLAAFQEGNHPDVPHVLYHGTKRNFKTFDQNALPAGDAGVLMSKPEHQNTDVGFFGKGFYFADPNVASAWSKSGKPEEGVGSNVMPVHLSMKNPFIVTHPNYDSGAMAMQHSLARLGHGHITSPTAQTELLKKLGHDGVIAARTENGKTIPYEWVALEPHQIKSAIGNNGNFDPSNPDITKAKGGDVEAYGDGGHIPVGDQRRDENLSRHMEGNYPIVPNVLYRGQKKVPQANGFITQHGRATPSFASDPAVASVYARTPSFFEPAKYEQSANVGAYHVSMKNPLDLSHHGEEITLGDLFDHLPVNTEHEHGLKKGMVGYGDIADSIIDLDKIAEKVGAKTNVDDPNYGGYWVRNFKELADMVDEAGRQGDHGALHDALHGATLDTYLIGDHPGFVNMLHRLGYDGIIHKDVFDAGEKYYEGDKSKLEEGQGGGSVIDAYRPFMKRPQIKSATGNNGHFDPSNPDITKSEGGSTHGPHKRAEEQGYSIKGYHFTRGPKAQSIAKSKQFDPYLSEGGENATFFWDNPQAANDWAHFAGGVDPNKPQEKMTPNELDRLSRFAPSMFPVRIHPGKHTVVNWPEATGLHSYDNVKMKKLIQNARNEGYDTVRIKNMREGDVEHELEKYPETPHDQIAVLNPNVIRSEFAQFDPDRQHENDIGARKGGAIDKENANYKQMPHSQIVQHALAKIGAPLPASMPLIGSLTGRRP